MLLEKGLIHLQPFQQKLVMAIVLSGLFTAVAIAVGGAHALLDLITGAIAVVGLMLGFYAAVLIFKSRFNMAPVREVLDKMDRMEATAHGTEPPTPRNADPVQRPDKAAPAGGAPKEEPPAEEKPDWRAGIKKIMDKK